ncbi:MAG: PQQ-binding-like beta-propeller repeat protein [Bryobacteraceae bacterium]|nr:PQQ-binding-like beta-propeller repeat protein [Bryobacteraceae bacterium]
MRSLPLVLGMLLPLLAPAQKIVWEARPGFRDFGKMVVAGGVVVSGNITGRGGTFGFDAGTGKLLWRAPGQMKSGPVTDGRLVYTVNGGVGVCAFDVKTGKLLWKAAEGENSTRADLLLDGGRLFVVGDHGKMWAYDAATGKLLWSHEYLPGGYLGSCPTTPVAFGGMVLYGGGERDSPGQGVFLWALDAVTGKEVWRFAAKERPNDRTGACVSRPAVGEGMVSVVSDNVIFGVDARTGVERWRKVVDRMVDGREYRRPLSPPGIHGKRVYSIFEEALVGWNLADGRQEFEFKGNFPDQNALKMMEFADGVVYFVANLEQPKTAANRQGFLYALDLATGQVRWQHRVNREKQYVDKWGTTYFKVDGNSVYYENESILVRLSQ